MPGAFGPISHHPDNNKNKEGINVNHKTPSTLDVAGAADTMKVHEETVLRLIRAGALPAARVGRAYVLLQQDVMDYVVREVAAQTAKRMRRPIGGVAPARTGRHAQRATTRPSRGLTL